MVWLFVRPRSKEATNDAIKSVERDRVLSSFILIGPEVRSDVMISGRKGSETIGYSKWETQYTYMRSYIYVLLNIKRYTWGSQLSTL